MTTTLLPVGHADHDEGKVAVDPVSEGVVIRVNLVATDAGKSPAGISLGFVRVFARLRHGRSSIWKLLVESYVVEGYAGARARITAVRTGPDTAEWSVRPLPSSFEAVRNRALGRE